MAPRAHRFLEGAHNVENGITSRNVREEGIAKASALCRTLNQPRDVKARKECGHNRLRFDLIAKLIKLSIGHLDTCFCRVDSAEREVFCWYTHLAHDVEGGRLSDVWQTHDTRFDMIGWAAEDDALKLYIHFFGGHAVLRGLS